MAAQHREPPAGNQWDTGPDPPEAPAGAEADKKLQAAIRKTLEQAARDDRREPSARSPLDVVIDVARRYPSSGAVQDRQVAADLVCELGKYALSAQIFHAAIERISPDIAAALLDDPIAVQHLNRAWLSARSAAGLTDG